MVIYQEPFIYVL